MARAEFAVASIEVKMPRVFTKHLSSDSIPAPLEVTDSKDLIAYQVIIPLKY